MTIPHTFIVQCIVAVFLFSSCNNRLSYFTHNLYQEYNWSEEELKQVQFYLSDDIILYKEYSNEEARIKDGKIKIRDGRKVEEIIFEKGTPGLLLFSPKEERLAVSFDEDDKFLMFGPNEKAGGRFVLLAKDWKKRTGQVTYGDQVYYTTSSSAISSLMVDLDNAGRVNHRVQKVKGRKID